MLMVYFYTDGVALMFYLLSNYSGSLLQEEITNWMVRYPDGKVEIRYL